MTENPNYKVHEVQCIGLEKRREEKEQGSKAEAELPKLKSR